MKIDFTLGMSKKTESFSLEIKKTENDSIQYIFEISLEAIANTNLAQTTVNDIMRLEKTPNIANQLEVLVEYFHAIEGTNRITSLAQYMRTLQDLYRYSIKNSTYGATAFGTSARPWTHPKI